MSSSRLPRLITEAAVIVVSILLAFALDAWWDERQEQARVEEVLDAVADEFEAEIAVLDSIIAGNEREYEEYLLLIDATDPDEPSLSEDSIRAWGEREPDEDIYESAFGTLATLISSGGLEQIPDLELRRSLAGWPAHVEDADWSRGQIYDGVDRLIDRQAELGIATEMLAPGAYWQSRVRATATDPLYRQYLASLIGTFGTYTDDLRALRKRATEILALLRARHGGGS